MRIIKALISGLIALFAVATAAHANTVTGTIHTLHINTQSNRGYVVSITVDGCLGGYPQIVAIDVVPR